MACHRITRRVGRTGCLFIVLLVAAFVPTLMDVAGARGLVDSGSTVSAARSVDPPFPTIHLRLVKGQPGKPPYYGRDYYSVRYCFARWPSDPARRPWKLHLGIDNLTDRLPPLTINHDLKTRCGTIKQPTPRAKRPWVMKVNVEAYTGNLSRTKRIKL